MVCFGEGRHRDAVGPRQTGEGVTGLHDERASRRHIEGLTGAQGSALGQAVGGEEGAGGNVVPAGDAAHGLAPGNDVGPVSLRDGCQSETQA